MFTNSNFFAVDKRIELGLPVLPDSLSAEDLNLGQDAIVETSVNCSFSAKDKAPPLLLKSKFSAEQEAPDFKPRFPKIPLRKAKVKAPLLLYSKSSGEKETPLDKPEFHKIPLRKTKAPLVKPRWRFGNQR